MKQRQQKELAENIINKISKELENPKTLNQILQQSVADVERKCSSSPCFPAIFFFASWDFGDKGEHATSVFSLLSWI